MLALTAFFFESLTGLGVRAKEQAQCRKSPQRGNILAKLESFFNSSRAKLKIKRRPKSTTRTPPCLYADRSEQRRGRHDTAPKNKQKATEFIFPAASCGTNRTALCLAPRQFRARTFMASPRQVSRYHPAAEALAQKSRETCPTGPRLHARPRPLRPETRAALSVRATKTPPPPPRSASSSVASFHPVPSPNRNWKSGGRGPPTESAEEPEPGLGCGPGRSRATERPAAGRRGSGLKGGGRAGGRTRPPGRRGGSCRQPPPPRPPPRLLPVR